MFFRPVQDDDFPRWRWLWQLVAIAAICSLAVVVAWQWTAWQSYWRVHAALRAIRDDGAPLTVDELDATVAVSTELKQRTLAILRQIAGAPWDLEIQFTEKEDGNAPTYSGQAYIQLADLSVEIRVHTAELVDRGAVFWPPVSGLLMGVRELLSAHRMAVQVAGERGQLDLAWVEYLRGKRLVDSILATPNSSLAARITESARIRLQQTLITTCGPDLSDSGEDIDRDAVLLEIRRLLDDRPARRDWRSAIRGERALLAIDYFNVRNADAPLLHPPSLLPSVYDTGSRLGLAAYMELSRKVERLAESATLREATAARPRVPTRKNLADRIAHDVADSIAWFDNPHFLFWRIGHDRCTSIALAACLYRRDFDCWPITVFDLAPDYLDSPPIDPFCAVGGVIELDECAHGLHVTCKPDEVSEDVPLTGRSVQMFVPQAPEPACVTQAEAHDCKPPAR